MMFWYAVGGFILFALALIGWTWVVYRMGGDGMRSRLAAEAAERRAARRAEARAALLGRHRLAPFPELETLERPADTGELRMLTAAAETGDLAEIGRQNAAFLRRLDLRRWVRA